MTILILNDVTHLTTAEAIGCLSPCDCIEDVKKGIEGYGLPVLLKARRDAYDGRGNYKIDTKEDEVFFSFIVWRHKWKDKEKFLEAVLALCRFLWIWALIQLFCTNRA